MATLAELVRQHTTLEAPAVAHLRRLTALWSVMADLGFADLQLCATSTQLAERAVVVAQVRPTTTQTLHPDDLVGRFVRLGDHPEVAAGLDGSSGTGGYTLDDPARTVGRAVVPVRFGTEVVAVLVADWDEVRVAAGSTLETSYRSVFERLLAMVASGRFPYADERLEGEESPRVGDGVILLDAAESVRWASPNATSALHRIGMHVRSEGRTLADLGFPADLVRTAFRLGVPMTDELERGLEVSVAAQVMPLIVEDGSSDGRVDGALVLVRDISELRRRDRMLVSMDATIREIHHRVKNNLQTVSSLLRLQGRRVEVPEAKQAIEESVRRIASIASVHEYLSRQGGDEIPLAEVVQPVLAMVTEALVSPDRPVDLRLVGQGPRVSAGIASSLAVIITELLQNAVEHGFPPPSIGGLVTIELISGTDELTVRVRDDGVGLAEDFDTERDSGLGLTIVRTLAAGELAGSVKLRPASDGGSVAELRVSNEALRTG